MSIWVYLAGNIITAVTILASMAYGVGRLCQRIDMIAGQISQIEQNLKDHGEHDDARFGAVNQSLLQLAMRHDSSH